MMTNRPRTLPEWLGVHARDPEGLPPGQRESDWDLTNLSTQVLFDPGNHTGPERLSEVPDIFGPLLRNDRESTGASVPIEGEPLDRLAWYRSFRDGTAWGIFIREAAVVRLADLIAPEVRLSGPDSEAVAWTVLYMHEYAHFLFDVAARSLEETIGTDVYAPYRVEVRGAALGWHPEAEAICNAFSYRNTAASGYRRRLRSFMRNQPFGYSAFGEYLEGPKFDSGVEVVLGQMLRGLGGRNGTGLRPLFDDSSSARVAPAMVPVHIVYEPETTPLFRLITCLSSIETTKAFDKQLRGLPAAARQAWADRVLPALLTDVRAAGKFKRLQGSHDLFSVRVHGTYRAILRQEGGDRWTVLRIDHRKDAY